MRYPSSSATLRLVLAGVVLAGVVLLGAALAGPALAEEVLAQDAAARADVRTVVFGSLDTGASSFLTVGAKWSPDSVEREGFAVLASAGYGMRFERDGSAPEPPVGERRPLVVRHTGAGAALAGYQWFFPWGVAALFAGPEVSYEVVASPTARPLGPRFGARLHGEVWANPTADTLLTATLILGSARESAWARASWGYRLLFDAFVGPEASVYADTTDYRKWALGAHVTGLSLGDYSFRVSGGWLVEEQVGPPRHGGYVSLIAWTRL